jgi:CheY-like chemotaxis protein
MNTNSSQIENTIEHLLVVDDDLMTDVLLEGVASNLDLIDRYVFESSGWKALEYLAVCKKNNDFPALILLDLRMPEIDGYEFLERYERLFFDDFPETKIVVVTNSTTDYEKQALTMFPSVNLYLNKPLVKDKFIWIYKTLFLEA